LPLLNGFVGEFLVLSGTFQTHPVFAILAATGVIWSAGYLLWMYQRVFFGKVTHEVNNGLPDLNLRERAALLPAAVLALVMGVAPVLWLNAIDPAVNNSLALPALKQSTSRSPVWGRASTSLERSRRDLSNVAQADQLDARTSSFVPPGQLISRPESRPTPWAAIFRPSGAGIHILHSSLQPQKNRPSRDLDTSIASSINPPAHPAEKAAGQ
jgi:hypothetical protein